MGIIGDFVRETWDRAKETPDQRRIRERQEQSRGTSKPKPKAKQTRGKHVPERVSYQLLSGQHVHLGETDEERHFRKREEWLRRGGTDL